MPDNKKVKFRANSSVIFYSGILLSIIIPLLLLNLPLFKNLSVLDMFSYGLGFVSIIATIFASLYSNYMEEIKNNQDIVFAKLDIINKYMKGGITYAVSKEILYEKLSEFVNSASSRIDLTYLGDMPPGAYRKSTARDIYIKTLSDVISSKRILVRRIILYTEHNKEWIKSLVKKYTGNTYISLVIISEKPKLPIVSVQIIDQNFTVLINLNQSDIILGYRDVVIESDELTSIFEVYYGQIYNSSIDILSHGKIIKSNYDKYLT